MTRRGAEIEVRLTALDKRSASDFRRFLSGLSVPVSRRKLGMAANKRPMHDEKGLCRLPGERLLTWLPQRLRFVFSKCMHICTQANPPSKSFHTPKGERPDVENRGTMLVPVNIACPLWGPVDLGRAYADGVSWRGPFCWWMLCIAGCILEADSSRSSTAEGQDKQSASRIISWPLNRPHHDGQFGPVVAES
jgi:hypothetical protein